MTITSSELSFIIVNIIFSLTFGIFFVINGFSGSNDEENDEMYGPIALYFLIFMLVGVWIITYDIFGLVYPSVIIGIVFFVYYTIFCIILIIVMGKKDFIFFEQLVCIIPYVIFIVFSCYHITKEIKQSQIADNINITSISFYNNKVWSPPFLYQLTDLLFLDGSGFLSYKYITAEKVVYEKKTKFFFLDDGFKRKISETKLFFVKDWKESQNLEMSKRGDGLFGTEFYTKKLFLIMKLDNLNGFEPWLKKIGQYKGLYSAVELALIQYEHLAQRLTILHDDHQRIMAEYSQPTKIQVLEKDIKKLSIMGINLAVATKKLFKIIKEQMLDLELASTRQHALKGLETFSTNIEKTVLMQSESIENNLELVIKTFENMENTIAQ
jgi:hypothetical protein